MIKKIKIGNKILDNNRCLIIAEAGVNHNGSLAMAEKLIKTAKKNGADFIKFQTYKAEKLTIKKSPRFWKWSGETKKHGSQFDSYKKLDSFEKKDYQKLKKLCQKHKIEFLSTPFDNDAVDLLFKLGVKAFKIASCDITNFPLLKKVAKTNLPILLSTGASNLDEIKKAVKFINQYNQKVCIMHCTLCYPTPNNFANLSAIQDLKKTFNNNFIGYSDHTLGVDIASASVVFGARIIEKHFTYNKRLKKSADHRISISPRELKKLRISIDNILPSIGIGVKKVLSCELKSRKYARRSLVSNKKLIKGQKIRENDLIPKRPGTGIPPNLLNKVIGKRLKRNIDFDHILKFKDLI